jgi:enamine deaminase RidA (YjgF/YER057c/UK114 family)
MIKESQAIKEELIDETRLSEGEREELQRLGMLSEDGCMKSYIPPKSHEQRPPVKRRATHASGVLNEAYDYFPRPSSFSRALSLDLNGFQVLLISGTASVDEKGNSIHEGDFRAQCWRTYRNITEILNSERMTWQNIVRTTCYLRDIERDYKDFNEVRTAFFHWLGLDPLPASTGVQARLCREDLLVEIEAIAVCQSK